MKITREELSIVNVALNLMQEHDEKLLEIAEKMLNDEKGANVVKKELETIEILKKKIEILIDTYYDHVL